MYIIKKVWKKIKHVSNAWLFIATLFLVFFSSIIMKYIEPETFPDFFTGLWWVMTTLTTVGYGDLSPVTIAGRLYAMFLFLTGIGLIGVVIGKVIDAFSNFTKRREEGRVAYKGEGHMIMIGWNRKTKFALEEVRHSEFTKDIVIVDQLPASPVSGEGIYYIQGDPASEETLMQANVSAARSVILFADPHIEDISLVDGKSLLIVSTIERIAPNVHTTVEIMLEQHISNFKYVHVNHFLVSSEMVSRLAVRSALAESHGDIVKQLIQREHGDNLYEIKPKAEWHTYRDAFTALLEKGATLIADRGYLGINRKLELSLPRDAKLQIVCDKKVYQELINK
ncbi:potassium channel family protein [Marinicrinis lubricantis]|uniref:Potassium channel family protein n=1 Tax=Marinicrinis lubricantis TaxID=2086470 RepID=A0ABW1IRJ6_9BACL